MKRLSFRITAPLIAAAMLLSGCGMIEMPPEETETAEKVVMTAPLAKDDFYGYVNFDTIQNAEFAYGDTSAGSFFDIQVQVTEQLKEIVKETTESTEAYAPGSNEQLIRDFYRQIMNYSESGAVMAELKEDIKEIRNAGDITSFLKVWNEKSVKYGTGTMPALSVMQDHKKPDSYGLYLLQASGVNNGSFEEMMKDDSVTSRLWSYAEDMLLAVGDDTEKAAEDSKAYVNLALELARFTDITIQYENDPYARVEFITDEEFGAMFPYIKEDMSLLMLGRENPYGGYYVQDKAQLEKIGMLLCDDYLSQWKIWAVTDMIASCGMLVADESPLLEAYFGIDNAEDMAENIINSMMENELGEIYAEKYYTEEMDKAVKEMFGQLIESYRQLISEADWLSDDARAGLLRKLENIRLVCGGSTHEINPDDAKLIGDNLFDTCVNIYRRRNDETYAKIGELYDSNTMDMTPQTVNACYNNDNKVTITVAIMNDPFFSTENSYYENLGGLGAVVGHEIGHAFDSNCINFDDKGFYNPEWLSEADRKVLTERADMLTEYFSDYTIMEVYHVDGELTNGENYADLGGVECITNLVDDKENLKTLFESYAAIWSSVSVDSDAISMLSLDVHSPERVRVNAVLSSCDKFYEAYDVKEGDGMYKAPEERVSRW